MCKNKINKTKQKVLPSPSRGYHPFLFLHSKNETKISKNQKKPKQKHFINVEYSCFGFCLLWQGLVFQPCRFRISVSVKIKSELDLKCYCSLIILVWLPQPPSETLPLCPFLSRTFCTNPAHLWLVSSAFQSIFPVDWWCHHCNTQTIWSSLWRAAWSTRWSLRCSNPEIIFSLPLLW